jgi:hypothetical protein
MVKEGGKPVFLIPTHRIGQDRQGDRIEIQRAEMTANGALVNESGNFLLAIDFLFQQIDFGRNKEATLFHFFLIFRNSFYRTCLHFQTCSF